MSISLQRSLRKVFQHTSHFLHSLIVRRVSGLSTGIMFQKLHSRASLTSESFLGSHLIAMFSSKFVVRGTHVQSLVHLFFKGRLYWCFPFPGCIVILKEGEFQFGVSAISPHARRIRGFHLLVRLSAIANHGGGPLRYVWHFF